MRTRRNIAGILGSALVATAAVVGVPASPATAEPCPDVEVVFARGTGEAPGVGGVGQAFVDSLRSQLGGKSVAVYPVNYPASGDFTDTMAFASTVVDGIRDAGAHLQATAANCPNTRMVLGGYSQGAVVAGYVTAAEIPPGVPAALVPQPLPLEVANHVAAVTLFGKPSGEFMTKYGAPAIVIGPSYAPKTIDLCANGDTICNGAPDGQPTVAHVLYTVDGMTNQAATFAADRI
jgi:cutinase